MAPDATTEKVRDENKSRFKSRQAVRSNPFMSKEAPSGGKSRQRKEKWKKVSKRKTAKEINKMDRLLTRYNIITTSALSTLFLSLPLPSSAFPLVVFGFWFTSNDALAARFTSRDLLASSWLLCHDAINLSAPNRTPVYHGTPCLRAASVQTSLSTPKVRRSVGVEPCRAPNALKLSLKLFLPELCRLVEARVSPPPLESLGEQQPLRESLVILSGRGPYEKKPSLANCRFQSLAPGFLEG